MTAIYKHELKSYATNVTAYVFGVFILIFAGIYTSVYNLFDKVANFEYVPGSMTIAFLISVPILTMRVLAEERRQKTDQLLYSLPVSMHKIVCGKYFAMMTVFLVPMLIISVYPLILKRFGNVSLATSYSTLLGFFLLGGSLMAIGMFVSSLTESQPVAAGLCFIVMLLNYYLDSFMDFVSGTARSSMIALAFIAAALAFLVYLMTKSSTACLASAVVMEAAICITYLKNSQAFEGLTKTLAEKISLFSRFKAFYLGTFDLTSIIYYMSVIAVFLFLSVQSMEKRRWS